MKRCILMLCLFLFYTYSYSQFPKYLYGTISYYGDEFKGKRTASGELFDPEKYTASHKTLPFGSEVLVENLENGRKVKLIINDRGPFVANRIMDVSRKAAEELGILRKGTAYAKITILKIGDNKVVTYEEGSFSSSSTLSVRDSSLSTKSSTSQPSLPTTGVSAGVSGTAVVPGTGGVSGGVVTGEALSTNVVVITKTNEVFITNKIVIPVTNVVEIPPYEEKIVEQPLTQKSLEDEFILEEPEEDISLPQESSSLASQFSEASSLSSETKASFSSQSSENFELMEREAVIDFSKTNVFTKQKIVGVEGKYYIQVGAFSQEANALKVYELLRKEKLPVFTTEETTKGKKWIKVKIGYYNTKESAEETLKKLENYKLSGMILLKK
ncbi:MAG: septal ring lytic transglycosylase RlpA family protein [Brevinematia bacterium]